MMRLLAIFLTGALLPLGWTLGVSAETVGMVVQVDGSSDRIRGSETVGLQLAATLDAGDRVEVRSGKLTFLFCPTSEKITASAGDSLILGESDVKLGSGAQLQRQAARRCSLPKVALGAESLERVGGLRPRGLAPIPLYLGGAVSTARPTFVWESLPDAVRYQVIVRNRTGVEVWSVESKEARVLYPEAMDALEAGRYVWEVNAWDASEELLGQQSARIQIKPDPNFSSDIPEEASEQLLYALSLENAGYYSEASVLYRRLRELNPDDVRWTRRLVWLYWNSGLIPAANREKERLDAFEQ